MMRRNSVLAASTVLTAAAVVAATAAAAQPAEHAKAKAKVKKGSYQAMAVPDPTMEATGTAGMECKNIDPESVDNHAVKLPGKGNLHVVLDSPNPAGQFDWDLYVLDAKGNVLGSSNSPTAHEEVFVNGVKGTVTIRSCNLAGEPTATVRWVDTYR